MKLRVISFILSLVILGCVACLCLNDKPGADLPTYVVIMVLTLVGFSMLAYGLVDNEK